MTKTELKLLDQHGIYFDEDCECYCGLFNNYTLYTDGDCTHVLDYGKYLRVKYYRGFWSGFFGMADYVNVMVYDTTQLKNVLSYIDTLKENKR